MYGDAQTLREFALPPEPSSARQARVIVAEALTEAGFAHRLADAELAISEVVTNAVLHGRAPITLRVVLLGDGVRVQVHDASPVSPAFSMLDPTAVTGRGLLLVSAVADCWGVDPDTSGKTVWFGFDHHSPTVEEEDETDRLLAAWADGMVEDPAREKVRVVLTDVDAAQLAAAEAHNEGLLRELNLVAADAPHFDKAQGILRAAAPLDGLRLHVRHQVAVALRHGDEHLDVTLTIRREDAEQVRDFMHALDEADRLSRLGELLVLPTDPEISAFRSAFLRRVLDQLRS